MATCNVTLDFSMPERKPFCGCDGLPLPTDFIEWQLEQSVAAEDYEFAAKCRDEIKRRQEEKSK